MKKRLLLTVTLASLFSLSSCLLLPRYDQEGAVKNEDGVYELQKNVYLDSAIPKSTVQILRFDETKVNYINAKDYFTILEDVYEKSFSDSSVSFSITKETDGTYKVLRENGSYILLDPIKDTITLPNYDLFVAASYSPAQDFLMDYGKLKNIDEAGVQFIAKTKDAYQEDTYHEIKVDLTNYFIDSIEYKDSIYLPFQTLSDLFMSNLYYSMAISSNGIYSPYYILGSDDVELCNLYSDGEFVYSKDLLKFNYYETCLNFDFNYGLEENKVSKGISTFDSYFQNKGLDKPMKKSIAAYEEALCAILYYYLDDPHCYTFTISPLLNNTMFRPEYGERNTIIRKTYNNLMNYIPDYNFMYNTYVFCDDMALIRFEEFNGLSSTLYSNEHDYGKSSGQLFKDFYQELFEKKDYVKRIVIDLTLNGGGDAEMAIFIASMFCGEVETVLKNEKTGSYGHSYYQADCNLDHVIDEKDYLISNGDFELYCLTSGYSFSCANFLPNLLSTQSDKIKIIGKQSGGGACAILPCTNIFGSVYSISSLMAIQMESEDGTYISSDSGVPVDYEIDERVFYDLGQLNQRLKRIEGIE